MPDIMGPLKVMITAVAVETPVEPPAGLTPSSSVEAGVGAAVSLLPHPVITSIPITAHGRRIRVVTFTIPLSQRGVVRLPLRQALALSPCCRSIRQPVVERRDKPERQRGADRPRHEPDDEGGQSQVAGDAG